MKKSRTLTDYQTRLRRYIDRLNEDEKERLSGSLYIIFTLITVSFFGIFAINPTLSTISNLRTQKQESEKIEQKLQSKIQSLDTLTVLYNRIESDLPYVFSAITTSTRIPYLTRQLEKLAERYHLTISRLDFQTIELYPGIKQISPIYSFTFGLSVVGNEQDVNLFINSLISFDRLVSIDSITTGKASSAGEFGASLTGRVYYLHAPQ